MNDIPDFELQDILVSIPMFMKMTDGKVNTVTELQYDYCLIKVKDGSEKNLNHV